MTGAAIFGETLPLAREHSSEVDYTRCSLPNSEAAGEEAVWLYERVFREDPWITRRSAGVFPRADQRATARRSFAIPASQRS